MPTFLDRSFSLERMSDFDAHETVAFGFDPKTGLRSIIAIHSTVLGPATGGTRYAAYASEAAALKDALRLSRAMTYKCALAGVPHGGGKGVIIAGPQTQRSAALFKAYAHQVNALGGRFSTGEDVGIRHQDIRAMGSASPYINGLKGAGDLGSLAAQGVLVAIGSALQSAFGGSDVAGRTVAIQGLGKVGFTLASLLSERGAVVYAADLDPVRVDMARRKIRNIRIVGPQSILKQRVDVFSPNALGGILDKDSIARLRCRMVCGAANNQLAVPKDDDQRLHRRGILYIPDYVANAGGLIGVAGELRPGGYRQEWVEKKIAGIGETVRKVVENAARRRIPTGKSADLLARAMIQA